MLSVNLIGSYLVIGVVVVLFCGGLFQVKEFEIVNLDLSLCWDNIVCYNFGFCVEGCENVLVNNVIYDEFDNKFDCGDVVINCFDLMSEFELVYKQYYGFCVSGFVWYDQVYVDIDVEMVFGNVYYFGVGVGVSMFSYVGGYYLGFIKCYYCGFSGELLDVFVFICFNFGDVLVSVCVGWYMVYWGSGLLIVGYVVFYFQVFLDGCKVVSNFGIEICEIFLLLGQFFVQVQVIDQLFVVVQYFLEWDIICVLEGGIYLVLVDVVLEGLNRMFVVFGFVLLLWDVKILCNCGNWGVMGIYVMDFLYLDISLFYCEFDDYNFWGLQVGSDFVCYVYVENVKFYGLSWLVGLVLGGGLVGVDLFYWCNILLVLSNIDMWDNQGV